MSRDKEAVVTTLDGLVDYFDKRVDNLRDRLEFRCGEDVAVEAGRLEAAKDVAQHARYLTDDGFSLVEAFTLLVEHAVEGKNYAVKTMGLRVLTGGLTEFQKGSVLEYEWTANKLSHLSLEARRKR